MSSDPCYILTTDTEDSMLVYSIDDSGVKSILVFQNIEDAQRYVIMLEEDEEYKVGERVELEITEVPLDAALEVFNAKGDAYILAKSDDLFVPPPTQ